MKKPPPKKAKPKTKPKSQPKKKKVQQSEDSEDEKITLPGQKYPAPPSNDATRTFYESLLKQKPDSLMAQEWCLKHGVLSAEQAKKVLKLLTKREATKKSK